MQDEPPLPDPVTVDDIDTADTGSPPSADDVRVSFDQLNAAFSRVTEEHASLTQQLDELRAKDRTKKILDGLIEPYAKKAYSFMCWYSGVVALVLFMNGFGCFRNQIEPGVLQVLVGSTAVTVIGLVGMVLTGIFVGARK